MHVSLYYLPQELTSNEQISIKNSLSRLNQDNKDFIVTAKHYGYFKQQNKERLCYLQAFPTEKLIEWNNFLRAEYKKESILDNQYSYVPHISLYRILNHEIFLKHKTAIEEILTQSITKITNENLFQRFFLFA
ncbi:MAG TPA: hypothetical protein VLF89_04840, partial [Candidatus Saccharimonadales bacterium]|nr:hypothetical protein [Candidatus Saccharimonadales bacterium]